MKKIKKNPEKRLTNLRTCGIIKVQKGKEVPTMMNWEYEEHYEELMEINREWLENQAE